MILRSAKIVKNRQDIMAESDDVNIDSQMDITQKSDKEIEDNPQVSEKVTSDDSANKEFLKMMHAMFNQLRENQEKMSNSLEEKLKENQIELIKSQENLKISMNNSLKDSLEKIEETMECLEDRTNGKIIEQKVEFNVKIQELEDRMIQRTMEETDWMKEYIDSSMTQRTEVIKSGISEVARQFDRRFQELDKVGTV